MYPFEASLDVKYMYTVGHNYVSFAPILLDDVLHRMEKINIKQKLYKK